MDVSPGERLSQDRFARGARSLHGGEGGRAEMLHLLQQQIVTRFPIPAKQSSDHASEVDGGFLESQIMNQR